MAGPRPAPEKRSSWTGAPAGYQTLPGGWAFGSLSPLFHLLPPPLPAWPITHIPRTAGPLAAPEALPWAPHPGHLTPRVFVELNELMDGSQEPHWRETAHGSSLRRMWRRTERWGKPHGWPRSPSEACWNSRDLAHGRSAAELVPVPGCPAPQDDIPWGQARPGCPSGMWGLHSRTLVGCAMGPGSIPAAR